MGSSSSVFTKASFGGEDNLNKLSGIVMTEGLKENHLKIMPWVKNKLPFIVVG